jgi:plastocyanin
MKYFAALAALALGACTAGGVTPSAGGGATVSAVTKINVSLTAFSQQTTPAGTALGFSPEVTNVQVGTGVQFINVDSFAHTASSFSATTFPNVSPLTASATSSSGGTLSGGFSSGTLQAGQSSQVLLVDRTGTYLYGCFFHYSGNMRGMIVAQ